MNMGILCLFWKNKSKYIQGLDRSDGLLKRTLNASPLVTASQVHGEMTLTNLNILWSNLKRKVTA